MHIPTVTDEMLQKVLGVAASPVFVEYTEADHVTSKLMRHETDSVSDKYDDRVIFVRIFVDENPEIAKERLVESAPTIVIYRRNKELKRVAGPINGDGLEQFLEAAITAL